MQIPQQIESISIARAANAPHYEYMTTFGKCTAELPVDHERGRFSHKNNTPLTSAVKMQK